MAIVKPKIIEYPNIRWNADWCKRCYICVEGCPKQALELKNNAIVEIAGRSATEPGSARGSAPTSPSRSSNQEAKETVSEKAGSR